MICYNFCQQCKEHFFIAGAKKHNHIFFVTFFLWNCISFRWYQHKRKLDSESLVSFTWNKFKLLLCKKLGNSKIFVDSFRRKIKQDIKYQQKDILDYAAHLEYLQVSLKEFNPVGASNKEILIWYFPESLRPFI